jgi:hypothetical protein
VRFGVSRTTKAPKSGRVKRPVPMISPLMASMMSAASRLAATAGIAVDRTMASVRNFLDTQVSFRACEGGERPALSVERKARGRPEHRILAASLRDVGPGRRSGVKRHPDLRDTATPTFTSPLAGRDGWTRPPRHQALDCFSASSRSRNR